MSAQPWLRIGELPEAVRDSVVWMNGNTIIVIGGERDDSMSFYYYQISLLLLFIHLYFKRCVDGEYDKVWF